MASICTANNTINSFFTNLYGEQPKSSEERNNTIYSLDKAEISVMIDRFKGCHVECRSEGLAALNAERLSAIQNAIENLAQEFKETKTCDSLWLNFSLPLSMKAMGSVVPGSFLIGASEKGDLIQDTQQGKLRVWQWLNLDKKCSIPPGATHNIGATALLCDTIAKKALIVVNVTRDKSWNLPGGHYDQSDKTPSNTALREAKEEAGIEFDDSAIGKRTLIGQMQFPKNQFSSAINQIWAFEAPGLSQLKLNPPAHEIKRAEWVDYQTIVESSGTFDGLGLGPEIIVSVKAVMNNLGAEEILNKGWMILHAPVLNG